MSLAKLRQSIGPSAYRRLSKLFASDSLESEAVQRGEENERRETSGNLPMDNAGVEELRRFILACADLTPEDEVRLDELLAKLVDTTDEGASDQPPPFKSSPVPGASMRSATKPYRIEGNERQREAARSAGATDARSLARRLAADVGTVAISHSEFEQQPRTALDRTAAYLARKGLAPADVVKARRILTRKAAIATDSGAPVKLASFADRHPFAVRVGVAW